MKLELRHGFDFRFSDHKTGVRFLKSIQEVSDLMDCCKQFDHNSLDFADHVNISPIPGNYRQISDRVVIVSGLRGFLIKSDQQERKDGLARRICDLCQPSLRRGGKAGSPGRQMLTDFSTTLPPLPPLFASTRPGRRHGSPGCHGYSPVLLPASSAIARCSRQQ